MDYIGPFDTVSKEATFGEAAFDQLVNANPDADLEGAIPPMELCKHPVAEILEVIKSAGLTPNKNDLTQLRQAIEAKIGAVFSNQITVGQVLAYNRVYPHVMTANNKLVVVDNEDGTVTLAADQTWVHRGLIPRSSNHLSLEARTVTIPAGATGHLRWRWNEGSPEIFFGNLADSGYNPSELVDGDPAFDTDFDDMLIARIARDGSDPPAITGLRNRRKFFMRGETAHVRHTPFEDSTAPAAIQNGEMVELDWARQPRAKITALNDIDVQRNNINEFNAGVRDLSRYGIFVWYQNDSSSLSQEFAFVAFQADA